MNRSDARKIAEELVPLLLKEIRKMVPKAVEKCDDEYMTTAEAAEYIRRSVSFLKAHGEIPSAKVGARRLYLKSDLRKFVRN